MTRIAAAGNVEVPAYLVLMEKGYEVCCEKGVWSASKDGHAFCGEGPIEVLGVVSMYEHRGEYWHAPDEDIERFLAKFCEE